MRTIAIGDIHGAFRALEQLMERINPELGDEFIFVGDYVDGWSESAQVVEFLLQLSKQHTCVFIKGNHDTWCEDWLNGGFPDSNWLKNGGKSTIASYRNMKNDALKDHLTFFKSLKNYYLNGSNQLFLHAGFTAENGVEAEQDEENFYWSRELWNTVESLQNNGATQREEFPQKLFLYHEIFIGHTPTIKYHSFLPLNYANLWNIDTGAAFNGKLTGIDIENKEIWQSDEVQVLYPNEKGRN